MKSGRKHCLFAAIVLLIGASLMAQELGEDESAPKPTGPRKRKTAEPSEARDISYLAEPLSDVRTNILELEREGYFAIAKTDFRTRANGEEAIVWTVRLKKTVTCRHLEAMLREFRDVRFYSTIDKQRLELLATLMHYPERITLGSSSNRLLGRDEEFELWIDLPTTYLQKLLSMRADTLVLRKWRY